MPILNYMKSVKKNSPSFSYLLVAIIVIGLVVFSYWLGKKVDLGGAMANVWIQKEQERVEKLDDIEFEKAMKNTSGAVKNVMSSVVDLEKTKGKYTFEANKSGLVKEDLVRIEKMLTNMSVTEFVRDYKSDIERPDGYNVAYKNLRQKFKLIITDKGVKRLGPEPKYSCPCALQVVGELVSAQ